jgi:diaminohydroxyphosphoribosylaminopyrimidine deaminase/5-amino-6-(5-phosphoribosylamino)uracil reductase
MDQAETDKIYMQRCIDLARLGGVSVAPNPLVGAVIVLNDKIIGEGYHQLYGEAHAEVNAIAAVRDQSLLSQATIYVSLEPCAHHGKTPPCADLLVKHQFKRVVIGCRDSYHEVSGKGIERLKKAGIQVTVGVLEQACIELNKRFFTFHSKKRPYVILKWAQSKDGYIDQKLPDSERSVQWISSPETQALVHHWRSEEQAILVGRKTIENDNPSLTVREVTGQNPIRVIIDSQLKTSKDSTIFKDENETLIINRIKSGKEKNVSYLQVNEVNTQSILEVLWQQNITSVFIEGGSKTIQHFILDQLWDEARVIVGNQVFVSGTKAPSISKTPKHVLSFSTDSIYIYKKS